MATGGATTVEAARKLTRFSKRRIQSVLQTSTRTVQNHARHVGAARPVHTHQGGHNRRVWAPEASLATKHTAVHSCGCSCLQRGGSTPLTRPPVRLPSSSAADRVTHAGGCCPREHKPCFKRTVVRDCCLCCSSPAKPAPLWGTFVTRCPVLPSTLAGARRVPHRACLSPVLTPCLPRVIRPGGLVPAPLRMSRSHGVARSDEGEKDLGDGPSGFFVMATGQIRAGEVRARERASHCANPCSSGPLSVTAQLHAHVVPTLRALPSTALPRHTHSSSWMVTSSTASTRQHLGRIGRLCKAWTRA